jgi:LAS superfamily LD-carboxypeptidase LdcB
MPNSDPLGPKTDGVSISSLTDNERFWYGIDDSHLLDIALVAPNNGSDRHRLQPAVLHAFLRLQTAASCAGIDCQIISSYRSFAQQQSIWDRKWQGELPVLDAEHQPLNIALLSDEEKMHSILRWSALPGGSRHHWGTDFDVIDRQSVNAHQHGIQLVEAEYAKDGICGNLNQWLVTHAHEYRFYRPYAQYHGGIGCEPWHYSFKPLAQDIMQALSLETITSLIKDSDIAGKDVILANIEMIFSRYILNQPQI